MPGLPVHHHLPEFAPTAWAGLGRAYSEKKQFEQAIACYQRALTLDPDNANFHYQLGQAYLKSGKKTAAQKEFGETRKLQRSSVERQAERLSGRLPEAEGLRRKPSLRSGRSARTNKV